MESEKYGRVLEWYSLRKYLEIKIIRESMVSPRSSGEISSMVGEKQTQRKVEAGEEAGKRSCKKVAEVEEEDEPVEELKKGRGRKKEAKPKQYNDYYLAQPRIQDVTLARKLVK
ncbi:hypothetical protein TRIUR3_24722 [Triticum urartu]|uniref:Uncharacterized protein n=1 Tax=Triticum urartu TaxID=4572 RepID=M7ZCF9_TRIUA|nr:hypothetical protein TRIUR3_24722 [Triticum urartu]